MKSDASPRTPAVCGRYAPSPTGRLHVGNARTALAAWLSVRARGGRFVYRVEDIDGPRVVPGADLDARRDLRWLGLDWDDGPDTGPASPLEGGLQPSSATDGEASPPATAYHQSRRLAHYTDALARLAESGRVYACRRSRRDLAGLASAPHGPGSGPGGASHAPAGLPPYPRAWRPDRRLTRDEAVRGVDAAVRFVVEDGVVAFEDRVQGRVEENVAEAVGDFVLRRGDGVVAYQLAAVVDDLAMGVTEVVRGADLLDSTARQIQLIDALGGTVPTYGHLGLVVNESGAKLSKRDDGLTLAVLRDRGLPPEALVGWLGWTLGCLDAPRPTALRDLVSGFDLGRVPPGSVPVAADLADRLQTAQGL